MTEHVLNVSHPDAHALAGGRSRWLALWWRQYRLERRMFWRNPAAAFFNFALPLLLLALFGAVFAGSDTDLDVVVPGIAGMSVMTTTFTALATNLVALREQGILKRYRGTPLPPSAYFSALGANALVNAATQVMLVTLLGHFVLGVEWPDEVLSLVAFALLGAVCFAALGVALAHAIPNFEAAPVFTNAVFLPTVILAGVFFDEENAPALLRDVAQVVPLTHLVNGMAGAFVHHETVGDHLVALAVLAGWTVAGVVLAVRGFSWEARRSD